MNSMGVRATLAVLLLFIAPVMAAEGGVTFWGEEFTMTCPDNGTWFKNTREQTPEGKKLTLQYNSKTKGLYHCKYQDGESERSYYFYVKGKVCANCFELDATLFAVAIAVDVVATAIVMMIIYRCSRKKSSAGPSQTSKAPARLAPPVPSPDYEDLNQHTRSQDPYSFVHRMG